MAMPEDTVPDTPIDVMRRETRVRRGEVPRALGGVAVDRGENLLREEEFLMRTDCGLGFHYCRGEGIVVERGPHSDPQDEVLYLHGSVYAAVAGINGFYPIHASSVACDGEVFAFTGASGAGKSTLIAELGRRGLPMFCDDTLILDISEPGRVRCLPGHKRLKLWPDALAMTGAARQEKVASDLEKFYAEPAAGTVEEMLPLAELCFLEEGDCARIEPVTGGERMLRLQDDHYTASLFLAAARPDRAQRFALLARLAQAMRMSRFVRPRDAGQFAGGAALVEDYVRRIAHGAARDGARAAT